MRRTSSTTVTVTVTVQSDNNAPLAEAGLNQNVNEGSTVTLSASGSSDPDGDPLTYEWSQVLPGGTPVALSGASVATATFTAPPQAPTAQETLTFMLVVRDPWGGVSTDFVTVTVQDIYAPPDCTQARATVQTLWPPTHEFVTVRVTGVKEVDPDITLTVAITGIAQDEPTSGLGTGDTPVDGTRNPDGSASVRAERSGKGDGRVYHLSFTANDGFGGACSGTVKVCVPHSRTQTTSGCVDQGPLYDSTAR